ncbi:hypothetical protein [Psychrobacter glacincola]|uniref:hypothetical protein n=1 Tax=Psychrobacter glacincola TaxID=56810 RepID=UPI0039AF2BF5
MIFNLSIIDRGFAYGSGYIAGTADGIVTVAGKAASRAIYLYALYNHKPMVFVAKVWSTAQGNYIFSNLDTSMRYLIMVRDYAGQYEPFAWDYVVPATDLTPREQYILEQAQQAI